MPGVAGVALALAPRPSARLPALSSALLEEVSVPAPALAERFAQVQLDSDVTVIEVAARVPVVLADLLVVGAVVEQLRYFLCRLRLLVAQRFGGPGRSGRARVVPLPLGADTGRAMSQENVALVRRAFDAFTRGDLAEVLATLDPAVKLEDHDRSLDSPRIYEGHGGFLQGIALVNE